MPIQFNCPECQSVLQTPREMVGKNCKCPTCGNVMEIPSPWSESPYAPIDMSAPIDAQNEFVSSPWSHQGGLHDPNLQPHRGETILVLGIFSLLVGVFGCGCCGLVVPFGLGLGIPAVIMGRADLKAMDENRMNPAGRGSTKGGMICGALGIVLAVLGVSLFVLQIIPGIVGGAR